MVNQSSTLDDAYFDRNQAAMLAADLALRLGWEVGISTDPDEPDWPVLYINLPSGQVSWHMPTTEIDLDDWPEYADDWDGHDLEEKRKRITTYLEWSQAQKEHAELIMLHGHPGQDT